MRIQVANARNLPPVVDKLHTRTHEILTGGGRIIELTSQEAQIIAFIRSKQPLSATKWDIAAALWGDETKWAKDWDGTIKVHMNHLRAKIKHCTFEIWTHWGSGYRMDGNLVVV